MPIMGRKRINYDQTLLQTSDHMNGACVQWRQLVFKDTDYIQHCYTVPLWQLLASTIEACRGSYTLSFIECMFQRESHTNSASACTTVNCLHGNGPQYLVDFCQPVSYISYDFSPRAAMLINLNLDLDLITAASDPPAEDSMILAEHMADGLLLWPVRRCGTHCQRFYDTWRLAENVICDVLMHPAYERFLRQFAIHCHL